MSHPSFKVIRALSADSAITEAISFMANVPTHLSGHIDACWHHEQVPVSSAESIIYRSKFVTYPELTLYNFESNPLRIICMFEVFESDLKQMLAYSVAKQLRTRIESILSSAHTSAPQDKAKLHGDPSDPHQADDSRASLTTDSTSFPAPSTDQTLSLTDSHPLDSIENDLWSQSWVDVEDQSANEAWSVLESVDFSASDSLNPHSVWKLVAQVGDIGLADWAEARIEQGLSRETLAQTLQNVAFALIPDDSGVMSEPSRADPGQTV